MPRILLAVIAVIFVAVLALAGCGGAEFAPSSGRRPGHPVLPGSFAPAAQVQPAFAIPSLAEIAAALEAPKAGSFSLAEGHRDGAEFEAGLYNTNVLPNGSSALYTPDYSWPTQTDIGGLAVAIYRFTLPAYTGGVVSFNQIWSDRPPQGDIYLGLGNWDSGSWQRITAPADDSASYPDLSAFIRNDDVCLVAVAVEGSAAFILDGLQFVVQPPPLADLQVDFDSGTAPLSVNFDATGSSDPDGSIVEYEWDYDGDGNFNESNNGEDLAKSDSTPPAFVYTSVGVFNATVRVTDNANDKDVAELPITVNNAPPNAVLNATPSSGYAPLDVDFNASGSSDPGGSLVDYEWDFNGNSVYNEAGVEADAHGDATPETYNFASPGSYDVRVRVTDDDAAQDVDLVTVQANNDPPLADLQADVTDGDAPLAVTFDASGSSDPGGSIVDYEWDFDGDSVYNEAGAEADEQGNFTPPAYSYTIPGYYTARVRVTDNFAVSDTATLALTVHGWAVITVDDTSAQDGYGVRMLLQNDLPLIACYTISGHSVRLLRSSTTHGNSTADWTRAAVISGTQHPTLSSLALIGGNPAVTFFSDDGTNSLYYSRSTTTTGMDSANWITPVLVDGTGTPGLSATLSEVQSKPAIAYGVSATADTRYARSSTATGASALDWANYLVDSEGGVVSMIMVDGNPAIAFSSTAGTIGCRYRRSSNNVGDSAAAWSGGVSATVYTDSSANYHFTMAVVNGKPAVALMDADATTLYYAHAGTTDGSGAWGSYLVDSLNPPTGEDCSLAVIGGKPAIGYYQPAAPGLPRYVSSSTVNGDAAGAWTNEQNITDTGSTGRLIRLL